MDKTIIEGNKLIAEFMGVSHAAVDSNLYYYVNGDSYDALKYHISWDWLHPVVDKIKDFEDECDNNTFFSDDISNQRIFGVSIFGSINYVWQAVIEFITWYNTTTKNKTHE